VSLASFTKHLESLERDEESTIAKTKQQERQITHESLSLKSLITNDNLSQLWDLERLEALIVS
jgi:DNA topoisomerase IB